MNENLILSLTLSISCLFILIIQIITPKLTRRNVFLGIKIPESEFTSHEIKNIFKRYVITNLTIGIPLLILFFLVCFKYTHPSIYILGIYIYLFFIFLIYLKFNKEMKRLKKLKNWSKNKKQIVIVDTEFCKNRGKNSLTSPSWFLISLALILLTIFLNNKVYPNLPSKVATHFDFNGHTNGFQNKSPFLIFELPLVNLFLTIIMFISYKVISFSKQELSSVNTEESKKCNILFKRINSIYLVTITIALNIIFTLTDFKIMSIINIPSNILIYTILFIVFLIIVSSTILSIKVGQGGSRLKFNSKDQTFNNTIDRDDDNFWKLGNVIYYNKQDPCIFLEKRFGIGWTINAANPIGLTCYIILILVLIISLIFPLLKFN